MTPDQLYALGYAIEYTTWGCYVYLDTPDHMEQLHVWGVHSPVPLTCEASQKLGWESALAHYIERIADRLEQ